MGSNINIMTDIETLSTRTNAVIHQIGMVAFDDDKIIGTAITFPDIRLQTDRHICPDTLLWTMEREVFRREQMVKGLTVDRAFWDAVLACVGDRAMKCAKYEWWSHHRFDYNVLGDALGSGAPFGYKTMDSYTLFQACGYEMPRNNHNALDDALNQARGVMECLKKIRADKESRLIPVSG